MARYIPYLSHFVPIQQFYGGQSSDEAIGTPASFSYSRAMDHRRNPSQLSVLPGSRQLSQGVVQDLILNMVQVKDGTRYGYGDAGNIYKISTSNVITYVNKLPTGSDGCLYRSDNDAVYFATQTDVRRLYPISNSPALDVTYGASRSTDSGAYRTGGSATTTYTIPLAIDETQLLSFTPDIEPFYSQKVNVVAKGTGNVTMTLHDGLNNSLATVTVTAANMTTGLVEFLYSSQIRALVKPNARTYHLHFTSTVADTTLACATANSLNTADYELWAYRLVDTINNFHPMVQFLQYNCIGNGNYLAVWEPISDSTPSNSEFQRHRLTFPAGFEVCGLAVTNEFLVIACAKYSTNTSKDFQEGKLFIWDGTAQTYNQVIDVSGGAPEGIKTKDNLPYFIVNGKLCVYAGGANIVQVHKITSLDNAFNSIVDATRVYPNMLCVKDNMLHMGYPSSTNNTGVEHGVYVWGSLEKNYPESFNYGYVPYGMQTTNTNASGNLQIGCVRSFGDEMYISYKDSSSNYSLDILDNLCTPAPIFKFRSRRFDAGQPYVDKLAVKQAVISGAIGSGVSITALSSIDGAAYVNGQATTSGTTKLVSPINQPNNFKRLVSGFDGTCDSTVTTSPIIYAHILEYKPQETQFAL
jgi:hypothetical protein